MDTINQRFSPYYIVGAMDEFIESNYQENKHHIQIMDRIQFGHLQETLSAGMRDANGDQLGLK